MGFSLKGTVKGWPEGTLQTCRTCKKDLPMASLKVARYFGEYSLHETKCLECRYASSWAGRVKRRFPGVDIDAIHRNPRWMKTKKAA